MTSSREPIVLKGPSEFRSSVVCCQCRRMMNLLLTLHSKIHLSRAILYLDETLLIR